MAKDPEGILTLKLGDTRVVTPSNPLIINAPVGSYGQVEIAGGTVSVTVPATLIEFASLTKTS